MTQRIVVGCVLAALGAPLTGCKKTGDKRVVVARWSGGELTLKPFLRRLDLERLKVELRRGRPLPVAESEKAKIAEAVLGGIVNQALLIREAKRRGFKVSPAEAAEGMGKFLSKVKVSRESLSRRLAALRATAAQFEQTIHSELLAQTVLEAERARIDVSPKEMEKARLEARWRGEGHFSDEKVRARVLGRKFYARFQSLIQKLRSDAAVRIFLNAGQALGADHRRKIEARAIAFYRKRNARAPANLVAEVTPMGCHSEIAIRHGKERLATLGYSDERGVFPLR